MSKISREEAMEFIVDYLEREYSLPKETDIETFDYVKAGYVDSIGMIQFITAIEDEFDLEFTEEDLKNQELHIIGRLADFILANKNG